MPPQTQQLYVALYGRRVAPPEGSQLATHHWALLVGSESKGKDECGRRYHVKKRATDEGTFAWFYEGVDIPLKATNMLDVYIAVAKVHDPVRLEAELKMVPVVQANEKWDCITWLKNALAALDRSGCLETKCPPWNLVERTAMRYIKSKLAVRRPDGQMSSDSKVTTYDLMEEKEINP